MHHIKLYSKFNPALSATYILQIIGGAGPSSSQSASQLSQPHSHSSQIQVDVHVRSGGVGNEALCLEILGKH